jgi:hypothetical protein
MEMKKFWPTFGFLVIVVVVCFGGYKLANNFLQGYRGKVAAACPNIGHHHWVIIRNNKVTPQHTDASRCDTLTIRNDDAASRLMAFGEPDHHFSYDDVTERLLGKGQMLTVTLVETGKFSFHDHVQDDVVKGTFTVRP